MRNALNNLQATFSGFKNVTRENVFKVCEELYPPKTHHAPCTTSDTPKAKNQGCDQPPTGITLVTLLLTQS